MIEKSHDEIVEEMLMDFAKELEVEKISDASDIAIKAKIYAAQIEGIYYNQAFIMRQSNPVTATDEYLDMWGKGLDVDTRNEATSAVGTVVFGRKVASDKDIVIPEGTMFSTNDEIYGKLITGITTEKAILSASQLEVTVKAKTLEVGEVANAPVGAFTVINNPPTGIEHVRNDEPFRDGTEREEDEEYRSRFKKSKFRGSEDDFANRAREVDGVTFAKTLEWNRGPGTSDILIATASGIPSDDLVQKALEHLLLKRPLGSDLGVIKPTSHTLNVDVNVTLKEGYTLTSALDGVTLEERIRQAIRTYIRIVGIGGVVRRMGIADVIYDLEEVIDVSVIEPLANITLDSKAIAEEGVFNVTTT